MANIEARVDVKGREYYFVTPDEGGERWAPHFMSATVFPHPNSEGYAVYVWWTKMRFNRETEQHYRQSWVKRHNLIMTGKDKNYLMCVGSPSSGIIDHVIQTVETFKHYHR